MLCLRTRGKKRVFLIHDKDNNRLCICKEGVNLGELNVEGMDGFSLLYREYLNLKKLSGLINVPKFYEVFYAKNNLYIIEEYIKGQTLLELF